MKNRWGHSVGPETLCFIVTSPKNNSAKISIFVRDAKIIADFSVMKVWFLFNNIVLESPIVLLEVSSIEKWSPWSSIFSHTQSECSFEESSLPVPEAVEQLTGEMLTSSTFSMVEAQLNSFSSMFILLRMDQLTRWNIKNQIMCMASRVDKNTTFRVMKGLNWARSSG